MVKAALHGGRATGERWGRVRDRDCPWHTRSRYTYISSPCCRAADFPRRDEAFGYYNDHTTDERRPHSAGESASHDRADKSPYPGVYHHRSRASLLAVAREVTIKMIAG